MDRCGVMERVRLYDGCRRARQSKAGLLGRMKWLFPLVLMLKLGTFGWKWWRSLEGQIRNLLAARKERDLD